MKFRANKFLISAIALTSSFIMSPVAFANTDTGLFHLHPHGVEAVASLCVIVAILVFAYVGFNAGRSRR